MTISNDPLQPKLRGVPLGFLVHNNPFYLLSALCMIAGCYVLNGALELYSGDLLHLLVLVGTINAYELMLIGLGLYLIRRRGLLRDGRTLLLLQTVFLFDLTFLNAETATGGLRSGLIVNAVLLTLGLLKVGAVLSGLSSRFPRRLFSAVAMQLVVLFAVPVLFKSLDHDGTVSGRHFYAIWWLVGMLPVLIEMQRLVHGAGQTPQTEETLKPRLGRLYVGMAFCSLLAHMGMMHWVYRVAFTLADLSPVLLGIAVALKTAAPTALVSRGDLRLLRLLLPATAVAIAFVSPPDLGIALGHGRLNLTAPLLATAAAYLAYVYLYFLPFAAYFITAAAATAIFAIFGPSESQIESTLSAAIRWCANMGSRIVPTTAVQWGVTALGAAFAFLGLGAAVSLSQSRQPAAPALPQGASESP